MFPQKRPIATYPDPKTYPLGEQSEQSPNRSAMAFVALSHTPVEQQLYGAMLAAILETGEQIQTFTARRLMTLAGIRSLSTIRRALEGLTTKLSIHAKVDLMTEDVSPGLRTKSIYQKRSSPGEM